VNVADTVGTALVRVGVDHVFGVVGSGNFHVTNAMVAAGARFVAARHEGGAATMADGFARMSGRAAAVTVHQGCGLTNAMTGITEAAKSRSPVLVLAAEVAEPRSNFYVDQWVLAESVGAVPMRVTSAETAVDETCAAVAAALHGRRTVLLNLPLHLQAETGVLRTPRLPRPPTPQPPEDDSLARLAQALGAAERPVFIAGRGSRGPGCREALETLADRYGALLATSAVARGLFNGSDWSLDVSGGFASPTAAELISGADLLVGWGCALNMWTMRHGRLIAADATVVQVDDDEGALGAHRPVQLGVVGDVGATARALMRDPGSPRVGYRTERVRRQFLRGHLKWRDVPFDDTSGGGRIDPRTLSTLLDDLLPPERVLSIDSGNFMGYPSMFMSVPDERGFCFTQAFQSIGLGLATAIGAALAQPSRLPVAAVGDGGLMMAAAELDTVRRLGLPMVVVVYNDDAYGAEVHHFGPGGYPLDTVTFPPTDIAAVARGYGFEAVTVTAIQDLAPVADWLAGERRTPLLIDAKVTRDQPSWWLEEAFRGH
jgi:thiamine pyrophosphate-dependent acetolactate synthase large subunit-like protein